MTLLYFMTLVIVALIINFPIRYLVLPTVYKLLSFIDQDYNLEIERAICYLSNAAPPLVFSFGIELIPGMKSNLVVMIHNIANAVIILTLALFFMASLDFFYMFYRQRAQSRVRSIKSLIQIAKIILFFITAILILALLMNQSPVMLLSGFGAMAALFILVFQDTLLSFVAGVQLSSTDMIRVGDWIEIPKLGANGDVIDIALHTVTVQNFDKTLTTVPIRNLVTDSFKNWRGMREIGARRIKRSLYIDQTSIRFLKRTDLRQLLRYSYVKEYIANQRNIERDRDLIDCDFKSLINMSIFRAYATDYLKNHIDINKDMLILVREMDSGGVGGFPIEVYCFTNTVNWNEYESIQSDIFDHLYSVIPDFGLRLFQPIIQL
jgi:miniconductance mechanosensitive channel